MSITTAADCAAGYRLLPSSCAGCGCRTTTTRHSRHLAGLVDRGDGIRSDLHAIAQHLNDTSGLASRLALLEIQLWEGMDGTVVAVPSIPVRTEVIEHRIVTLPTGELVQLQRPDEPVRDREPVAPVSQDKDANRVFWQHFIDTVTFDHPDQPKPRHGGNNWVRIALPDPIASMTAYRTRDGEAGIFFKVSGAEGQAALEALKPALLNEGAPLAPSIKINEMGSGATFRGGATLYYPGDTHIESELQRWLQLSANDLVNLIRPVLGQLERERGE